MLKVSYIVITLQLRRAAELRAEHSSEQLRRARAESVELRYAEQCCKHRADMQSSAESVEQSSYTQSRAVSTRAEL